MHECTNGRFLSHFLCTFSQHFDDPQPRPQGLAILVAVGIVDTQRGGADPETCKQGANPFFHILQWPWSTGELAALSPVSKKVAAELPPSIPPGVTPTQTISDATFAELTRVVTANLSGFGPGRYGLLTYFWDSDSGAPKIDCRWLFQYSSDNSTTIRSHPKANPAVVSDRSGVLFTSSGS